MPIIPTNGIYHGMLGETDEDDKQRLVDTGLSPEEIFDANGVIAWLNYINRITYGLRARSNGYYFGRNRLPDPADLQRSGDAFSVSRNTKYNSTGGP